MVVVRVCGVRADGVLVCGVQADGGPVKFTVQRGLELEMMQSYFRCDG